MCHQFTFFYFVELYSKEIFLFSCFEWLTNSITNYYTIFKLMMSFLKSRNKITVVVLVSALLILQGTSFQEIEECDANSHFYNIMTHTCEACPNSNTVTSQLDRTYCNCSNSHYKNPSGIGFRNNDSCLELTVLVLLHRANLMQPLLPMFTI